MLANRRLPFAVQFDQPWIKPQLRRAEANQFLEEVEGLLLRKFISLRRALMEIKGKSPGLTSQIDQLMQSLDSCDHVCAQVNDHVAHTSNPARRPNAVAWNVQMLHLTEAQKAICKVAVTLDRYLLRRHVPINIIPVQQYDIMEDFKLWVPDATIQELYKFWHAHNREVNA